MKKGVSIGALVLTSGLCAGCASSIEQLVDSSGTDLLNTSTVYTLTNLHPDEQRARLYAVNYQQSGLIPRCSEVRITQLNDEVMNFVALDRDKEYEYLYHDAAAEPFSDHLLRFFGSECDPSAVETLSETDQEGIRDGVAEPGMSRQGVIYAIGYPPRHVNPRLEADEWTYWSSRFDRFIVEFDDDGMVANIRD